MDGNDYVGNIYWNIHHCFAGTEKGLIYSKYIRDHPCQYLRVRDGCTVYYLVYELSSPVPHNALIGGYTEEGFPVYVGRELPGQDACSYIPNSNRAILGFSKGMENMGLLVVL